MKPVIGPRPSSGEGRMTYRGRNVDLSQIRRVALMTVQGEKDDISGVGQTAAAPEVTASPDHRAA